MFAIPECVMEYHNPRDTERKYGVGETVVAYALLPFLFAGGLVVFVIVAGWVALSALTKKLLK